MIIAGLNKYPIYLYYKPGSDILYLATSIKNEETMKKIILFLFFGLLLVPSTGLAQQKSKTPVKTTKVATKTVLTADVYRDNKKNLVAINFSQELTEDEQLSYYHVLTKGQNVMVNRNPLLNELYYRPRLMATTLVVKGTWVLLFFNSKKPDAATESSILTTVIKIVRANLDSRSKAKYQLEVNGYDPTIGTELPLVKMTIPDPILIDNLPEFGDELFSVESYKK